jgi:hypothetical protein
MTKIELPEFHDALATGKADLVGRKPGRDVLTLENSSDDLDRIQGAQLLRAA